MAAVPLGWHAHLEYRSNLHWKPFDAKRFDNALDSGRDVLVCVGFKPTRPWRRHVFSGYSTNWRNAASEPQQLDTPEFCQFVYEKRISTMYVEPGNIDQLTAEKLFLPRKSLDELPHIAIYLPTARKHEIVLYNPSRSELTEMLNLAYKKPMLPD